MSVIFDPAIEHGPLNSELIRILPPAAAFHYLEQHMSSTAWIYEHPRTSDFAKKHYFEGKAEGKAEGIANSILAVLDARGFTAREKTRTRITACADLSQLQTWHTRAVTAATVDAIFA